MVDTIEVVGPLIGMLGKARCGKDTVAQMIRGARPHVSCVAFAKPMKDFCKLVYDWSDDHVYGHLKDVPDERYPRPCKECNGAGYVRTPTVTGHLAGCSECDGSGVTYLTPREALQKLGTEWGRDNYDRTWIDLAFRTANELFGAVRIVSGQKSSGPGCSVIERTMRVVITDCRFLNEAQAVKEAGGAIIRITRPSTEESKAVRAHASEEDQDSDAIAEFVDYELMNDTGLDRLRLRVEEALRACGM